MLAFLSSLAALLVIAGGGLALYAIRNSGERGIGALMALCSVAAFAGVMLLIFVREGAFDDDMRRAGAVGVAVFGAIPPAALAFAAIRFAGMPLGSPMPFVDWSILLAGIFFAAGAVSTLALGHQRSQETRGPPLIHMQQIRDAQQQLRSAFESDARDRLAAAGNEEDEIQVSACKDTRDAGPAAGETRLKRWRSMRSRRPATSRNLSVAIAESSEGGRSAVSSTWMVNRRRRIPATPRQGEIRETIDGERAEQSEDSIVHAHPTFGPDTTFRELRRVDRLSRAL